MNKKMVLVCPHCGYEGPMECNPHFDGNDYECPKCDATIEMKHPE